MLKSNIKYVDISKYKLTTFGICYLPFFITENTCLLTEKLIDVYYKNWKILEDSCNKVRILVEILSFKWVHSGAV